MAQIMFDDTRMLGCRFGLSLNPDLGLGLIQLMMVTLYLQ